MKNYITFYMALVFAIASINASYAQKPTAFNKATGNVDKIKVRYDFPAEGRKIVTDAQNNVYVAGTFEGGIFFGDISVKAKHQYGFFIAKFNNNGEFEWVKHGGNYDTRYKTPTSLVNGLEVDTLGNVYINTLIVGLYDGFDATDGNYRGKAYFEDIELDDLGMYTGSNTVLLKLSPMGNLLWKWKAPQNLYANSMDMDKEGNIYLTGSISNLASVNGKTVEANGVSDIMVMKISNKGEYLWFKQFGAGGPANSKAYKKKAPTDNEFGNFISVNGNGDVFIAGMHYDGAVFESRKLTSGVEIGGIEAGNPFVCKLNSDGKMQWVKNGEGNGVSMLTGLLAANNGDVYLSGHLVNKKTTFDGKKAKGPFLMKINTNGNIDWADDADSREYNWTKSVKLNVLYISAMALNPKQDYLYATSSAIRVTKQSHGIADTYTSTSTETLVALGKIEVK